MGGWAARRSPDGQLSSTPLLCRASPASSSLAPWAPSPSSSFRRAGLFHALLKIQDFLSFCLVSLFENSSPPHPRMYVCMCVCKRVWHLILSATLGVGLYSVSLTQVVVPVIYLCLCHRMYLCAIFTEVVRVRNTECVCASVVGSGVKHRVYFCASNQGVCHYVEMQG